MKIILISLRLLIVAITLAASLAAFMSGEHLYSFLSGVICVNNVELIAYNLKD